MTPAPAPDGLINYIAPSPSDHLLVLTLRNDEPVCRTKANTLWRQVKKKLRLALQFIKTDLKVSNQALHSAVPGMHQIRVGSSHAFATSVYRGAQAPLGKLR